MDGIMEETSVQVENGRADTKLVDFIPIIISPEKEEEKRFSCIHIFRKISWKALFEYCKEWIKHPMNMAISIWILAVGAGLVTLLLVSTGILNHVIPESSDRKRWVEVNSQILNALFTIMCLYQQPRLVHHIFLLYRWKPKDVAEMRRVYCKYPTGRPHERLHMVIVAILLNVTCFAQYVLCGLYWGYRSSGRPASGVNVSIAVGVVAPVAAFVYTVFGPLGSKYEVDGAGADVKVSDRKVAVDRPQWEGGLFDCSEDMATACLSFFCTFCVFGWNMERLRFGNKYVHLTTFLLLCVAPLLVFTITALKIDHDDTIRYVMVASGVVLCFFGLFYGGFWRMKMRKRFHLPDTTFCFGHAGVTDFVQWLFCWSCSLAQEVRTAGRVRCVAAVGELGGEKPMEANVPAVMDMEDNSPS